MCKYYLLTIILVSKGFQGWDCQALGFSVHTESFHIGEIKIHTLVLIKFKTFIS